jgi:hypothetical protein
MTKGREKSDHRIVPKKGGNVPGGKAVTASEQTIQLNLFFETAESPKGDDGGADVDRSRSATYAVPKSGNTARHGASAMAMSSLSGRRRCLGAVHAATEIAVGGNAGVGIHIGAVDPTSRGAGCAPTSPVL